MYSQLFHLFGILYILHVTDVYIFYLQKKKKIFLMNGYIALILQSTLSNNFKL